MKSREQLRKIWLVMYYPKSDLYEEATLESVISNDIDMWTKRRKEAVPFRILSAHDSFDEAHEHLESLRGE